MPPRFLLAGAAARGRNIEVVDTSVADNGGQSPLLAQVLKEGQGRVWVVAPASVDLMNNDAGGQQLRKVWRVWPHLSMEDTPRSLSDLALVVYDKAEGIGIDAESEPSESEGMEDEKVEL